MRYAREATGDAASRRRLVTFAAGAAVLLGGARFRATAASPDDCRLFHDECSEARAAGYRDVGICRVERLECPGDDQVSRVPSPPRPAPDYERADPEASSRERSIGP